MDGIEAIHEVVYKRAQGKEWRNAYQYFYSSKLTFWPLLCVNLKLSSPRTMIPSTFPPFFLTAISATMPSVLETSKVPSVFIHMLTLAALKAHGSLGGYGRLSLADFNLVNGLGTGLFGVEGELWKENAIGVHISNLVRDGLTGRDFDTTVGLGITSRGGCGEDRANRRPATVMRVLWDMKKI